MRTERVKVTTPGRDYEVVIGPGARAGLRRVLSGSERPSTVLVVGDARVLRHHGDALSEVLGGIDVPVSRLSIPSGERSKSVAMLERIWRTATRRGVDRRACLIAFGGGVVGDLTGFAAATLLRGVDFVQVPTTLLAMVDASVGGKTGINVPEGKNLVGAFHQPRAVLMDTDFLETLPPRELRAGFAEVIKTAAIRDARLVRELERSAPGDRRPATDAALSRQIARCVRIKAGVVEADERESGLRMILNFGHTLAHGIEAAASYGKWLHGEAVAVGMVFAARLGEKLGCTSPHVPARLERLIADWGLPVRLRGGDRSRILAAMARDKKRGPRGLRWVFLRDFGETVITDEVPMPVVRRELDRFLGEAT